ncbi:MAG: hypothetical protein ACRC4W_02310 [Treponemataceae bacterium]
MIDLNEKSKECLAIARARGLRSYNEVKHLASEVVELQEAISFWQKSTEDKYYTGLEECKKNISMELADVIICAMSIAERKFINIEKAILEKIEINRSRIKK